MQFEFEELPDPGAPACYHQKDTSDPFFCSACGAAWYGPIEARMLLAKKIKEQKGKKRGKVRDEQDASCAKCKEISEQLGCEITCPDCAAKEPQKEEHKTQYDEEI